MITAEKDPAIVKYAEKHAVGSISNQHIGMYYEIQLINYLELPVYSIDHNNIPTEIPQSKLREFDPHVRIIYRQVVGERTIDNTNFDRTKEPHHHIKINLQELRRAPVFCEITNCVIATAEHQITALHPHSAAFEKARLFQLQEKACRDAISAPFTIVANDPSGKIKHLWVELHGRLVSAQVSSFSHEPDTIVVGYRDLKSEAAPHELHRATFGELLAKDPHVWTIGDCILSSNRERLRQYLQLHRGQKAEDSIPISVHLQQVDEARKLGQTERKRLEDEIAALKKQISSAQHINKLLESSDYSQHAATIRLEELRLEGLKLETSRANIEAEREQRAFVQRQNELKLEQEHYKHLMERKVEREKLTREVTNTVATVVKTGAIVIPIAYALYKALQSKPQK